MEWKKKEDPILTSQKLTEVTLTADEMIGEYGRYVYNLALRLTANPQNAEDLSQETFIKAWLHREELINPVAIKKWLRTICVNEFRMSVRKEKQAPLELVEDMEELERIGSVMPEFVPEPVDEVIVAEEIGRLREGCFLAMAGKLPLNQRIAFSLVDMFGMTINEVAELLGVTPKAVKGLLYRARMSLEAFFKDHCKILDEKNPCSCQAWIDFSLNRSGLQSEMRQMIETLDYRKSNYEFDPETRQKLLHYYHAMPERTPSKEWYENVIVTVKNILSK